VPDWADGQNRTSPPEATLCGESGFEESNADP
jgi:hypothetical protein